MRSIKKPEERRQEILDAAERLFAEKGYDAACTNDILAAVGIARGTLYYHFKSKEEILDAVVERSCGRALETARRIAADSDVPVLDRVFLAIGAARPLEAEAERIMEHLHRPQNALMHQKSHAAFLQNLSPIVAGIVEEGLRDGTFRTDHPRESVEMVLAYGVAAFDEQLFGGDGEARRRRARAFLHNLELLFGAERGCMDRFESMLMGETL